MDGAIATSYKLFGETADIQSFNTFFAIVTTAQELDTRVWVVGKEISNL